MSETLLACRGLSKSFGALKALDDVSLDVERGAFVVLLGPSGSGKTTLLGILGGFVAPDAGRVSIEGREVTAVPPARRPTTTVFQDYALFPHLTVAGNVGFGLRMRGVPRPERRIRVREALELVGLPDIEGRRPHELSGGQRQRVALARALVVRPLVLLLDEPLGALDLKLRRQMQDELKALQRRVGTTFVHVTHDQEEAMALADQVVVLDHGRIEDAGPPDRVYRRPASLFAATFMGESNLIEGRIVERLGDAVRVTTGLGTFDVAGAGEAGQMVTLVVRPEQIATGPCQASLGSGRVAATVFQGAHQRATVDMAGGATLKVALPSGASLRPGDAVELGFAPSEAVALPAG